MSIETSTDKRTAFYHFVVNELRSMDIPFLVGGGYALEYYTGYSRYKKDLDLFIHPQHYPEVLLHFNTWGMRTELTDTRWLAKLFDKEGHYIDIIFNTVNNICKVDDPWFEHAEQAALFGDKMLVLSITELIWCKIYIHNRERYDNADINHLIVRSSEKVDWERLLAHLGSHWPLLLSQIILFQFIYPSEYDRCIPEWLRVQLLKQYQDQCSLGPSKEKLCLGPLIDQTQYEVDVKDWGFKSITCKTI